MIKREQMLPESWLSIVARDRDVTRVRQVAFVQVGAPSAVARESLGAGTASVERRTVYIIALHALMEQQEFIVVVVVISYSMELVVTEKQGGGTS